MKETRKVKASFYFIPCYYDIITDELCGTNGLFDALLLFMTGVHQFLMQYLIWIIHFL